MDHKDHRAALIPQLINAYGEWVEDYIDQGFRVYLVTFKFNNIQGSNTHKTSEMLREIENQFYPTLIKHVERWPMKTSRQRNLPSTTKRIMFSNLRKEIPRCWTRY